MTQTSKESAPESVLPDADSAARNRVCTASRHPDPGVLERFVRGELSGDSGRAECRVIVRHLLTGCPQCARITGRLWALGELPGESAESDRSSVGSDGSDPSGGSDPPARI
jgi:hypothetical protein